MTEAAAATGLVEVAALAPVPGLLTYRIPAQLAGRARVGARVLAPLGGRKISGVVMRVDVPLVLGSDGMPLLLRELVDVIDEPPALTEALVGLCLWIAEYYEAPPGEVVRGALPPGTAVGAADFISLTQRGEQALVDGGAVTSRRRDLLAHLAEVGARPPRLLAPRLRAELPAALADGLIVSGEQRQAACMSG